MSQIKDLDLSHVSPTQMFETDTYIGFQYFWTSRSPVAKFIVPVLGDIVDSGIGLSYRPASLCNPLAGRYNNPMPELILSPPSVTMNLATVLQLEFECRLCI
jgi:hypothetical protein